MNVLCYNKMSPLYYIVQSGLCNDNDYQLACKAYREAFCYIVTRGEHFDTLCQIVIILVYM